MSLKKHKYSYHQRRRDNMTPQKFYKDVVKGDSIIKRYKVIN